MEAEAINSGNINAGSRALTKAIDETSDDEIRGIEVLSIVSLSFGDHTVVEE